MDKHYTVMALLVTEDTPHRVLLVENRKHKRWLPPGGHQESGENPLEAAIREVREEVGIDITKHLPKPTIIDNEATIIPLPARLIEVKIPPRGNEPAHYHLDFLYVVHVPESLKVTKNNHELVSAAWLSLEDTADIFVPEDIRRILIQEMK